jgi:hypothetical protein
LIIAKIHRHNYSSSPNITDFIKKTIARKRNKIIHGCLKLHPGKWMCSKLCSAMYMAIAFPASTQFLKKKPW